MNKEIKSVLKKTVRIAGVTFTAAGAVAVMTSGVALKAIAEGGKYLAGAVKRIIQDGSEAEEIVEEAPVAEEAPVEEASAVQEEV